MKNLSLVELIDVETISIATLLALNEFRNNESSFKFMNIGTFKNESMSETREWLYYKLKKSYKLYLLFDKEICIGFLNLVPHDLGNGIKSGLEIGIAIFEKYRGNRYGSQALEQILLIKNQLSTEFIIARVMSSNKPSISLFNSSGFRQVAEFPNICNDNSSLIFFYLSVKK